MADNFYPRAEALRARFDARFGDPKQVSGDRFVWDYWHVPDQYTLLRTPAADFFGDAEWPALEGALLQYAERELGCSAMTPVWLSCYVDGCGQELHADVPHGPWAFVYSLTEWDVDRAFVGGETQLLRPETLDYWRGWFDGGAERIAAAGLERDGVVETVEPRFNRLTVFDPRVPHGVREVRGTRDVRKGRLVLHGWFSAPSPFFEGALAEDDAGLDEVEACLNAALEPLYASLGDPDMYAPVVGMLSVRVTISSEGGPPASVRVLACNLHAHPASEDAALERAAVVDAVLGALRSSGPFPASGTSATRVTLPLSFA